MKRLTFSILWTIFAAAFAIAQKPQIIQQGFTVERELGGAVTQVVIYSLPEARITILPKSNKKR